MNVRKPSARAGRGVLTIAAALTAAILAGCGSAATPATQSTAMGGMGQPNSADAAAMANPNLDLGTSLDNQPAPDIKLANQFGQPM